MVRSALGVPASPQATLNTCALGRQLTYSHFTDWETEVEQVTCLSPGMSTQVGSDLRLHSQLVLVPSSHLHPPGLHPIRLQEGGTTVRDGS